MAKEVYFRPPSEANSFIVRVMQGCSHNKCAFCNQYRDVPCRVLPLDEVIRGMEEDAAALGPKNIRLVDSMYLEGGDPLLIRSGHLLEIMRRARELFPNLGRFACYATAKYTVRKNQEELDALAEAGLKTVFVGLESGSDAILARINKGCDSADIRNAALKLARAGIEMDVSMMIGIGGREDSTEHAVKTARLINAISPICVRVRTFVPKEGTELGEAYLAGNFAPPDPHEALRELRLLVSEINVPLRLLSEHWSNFVLFDAYMPGARGPLMGYIDKHLATPESAFRKVGIDAARS